MQVKQAASRQPRRDGQINRELLLKAAKQLIGERGIDALTVVAVAKQAGLNRSTAYQHFASRNDLLEAVMTSFSREFREVFAESRSLSEQFDFFVDHFHRHPDIARIWVHQILQGVGDPETDFNTGATERLAEGHRSQDNIDAEMLSIISTTSTILWSLMVHHRTKSEAEALRESKRFTRELKRLFLYGALRSEHWPNLAAELSPDHSAAGD